MCEGVRSSDTVPCGRKEPQQVEESVTGVRKGRDGTPGQGWGVTQQCGWHHWELRTQGTGQRHMDAGAGTRCCPWRTQVEAQRDRSG